MSSEIRMSAYLTDICEGLKEKADASIKQKSQSDYDIGYTMAMYEVISLLHQQAEVFDIPLRDLGLEGVDPERDYLCSNQTLISCSSLPSIDSAIPLWEIIESTEPSRIPFLEKFKFDGRKLGITVQFSELKKTLVCENVLCFSMIEEGCAFRTLETQNFDGKAWLLRTNQSELLDWFNLESESIYADSMKAYMVVTQDQIFEFLSNLEIKII